MNRTRLLPRDQGAAPLDVVIGVMAFLAALALGAALLASRTAEGWRAGLSDRLTVQVMPPEDAPAQPTMNNEVAAALAVLRATPGIGTARALDDDEILALVEPWLGQDALVADLPLPRLIDAAPQPGGHIDLKALSARLKQAAPHANLDDHSRWITRLKDMADAVAWSAYGILLLIAIATAAAVAFATRAGLEAHHEMVQLLHQMGARGGFIARAFERHYFLSALGSAAAGASFAAIGFAAAGSLEAFGIGAVPFLPPLSLRWQELLWLAAVPFGAGLIALVTTRASVFSALRRIY